MSEFLLDVIYFILEIPARIVSILLLLITLPIWIWLKEKRKFFGSLLLELFYKDLEKIKFPEDDEEYSF